MQRGKGTEAYDVKAVVDFADRELRLIAASLPTDINQQRLDLLPKILRDWGNLDFPELLQNKPELLRIRREHFKRLSKVKTLAEQLGKALSTLDEGDRLKIILSLACPPERFPQGLSALEIERAQREAEELHEWLPRLAAAAGNAGLPLTPRPGAARNDVPYLVLQDLAAIFEWLTGRKASRQVDRDTKEETGPFKEFAAAIWPVLFRSGDDGLPSAMRNWAIERKKHRESSAVIANINCRHPAWGISDP